MVDTTGDRDLLCAAFAWADLRGAQPHERIAWAQLYSQLAMGVPTAVGGAVTEERLLEEGAKHGLATALARPRLSCGRPRRPTTPRWRRSSSPPGGRRGGSRARRRWRRCARRRSGARARSWRWTRAAWSASSPPSTCEIDLLYTHPRAWGRGVGRLLLDAGEAVLREGGCTEATLWTEERNERARRVYEAAGWRPDGEVEERVWNGAPLTELRYRKAL